MKKIFKGLPRNIWATGITSFFTDTSTKMVYSIMPLFLMSIGASKTTISLIEGIAESTASLLKAVSGYWSDKIGRNKPFMLLGYGVTAIVTPLYAFIWLPIQVLIVRFVERVGKGIRTAPRDSLISTSIPKGETGRSFGFQKAMDNSGAIVGPLLASLFLFFNPKDYSALFLWATIPAILGVLAILFGIKEKKTLNRKSGNYQSLRRLPKRFYLFLLVVFLFSLGNSSDALLLIKTSETGINEAYIPFVYMIFNATAVLLAIPIGKLSDKIGREKLITAGFFVYAVTYFLFGRYSNISLYVCLFIMYGVYGTLTDVSQKSFISDLVDKDLKGTGYGLYHAVLGLTLLPASFIGGWLYDNVNSSIPFYFGSVMAFIAAIAMLFIFGMKPKKQE
ncbi:MAG: MFS transporter [Fermentimonas sp.]|jgi:MFS family permease